MSTIPPSGDAAVVNSRSADRYTLTPRLQASFGATEIWVIDFSATGLQAQHEEPIRLGIQARISFALSLSERVSWRGRVVWSHLAKQADERGKHPYLSGVRIEEESSEVQRIIGRLQATGQAFLDDQSIEKKRRAIREKAKERASRAAMKTISTRLPEISTDQLLMIHHARERLQTHPDEAKKWYARAKFVQADEHTFLPQHYRDDALAVWEYLERTIELEKIVRVFEGELK